MLENTHDESDHSKWEHRNHLQRSLIKPLPSITVLRTMGKDKWQKTGKRPKLCQSPRRQRGGRRAEELHTSLISFVWENRSNKIICNDPEDNRWLNSQDRFAENKLSQANFISSYDSPVDQSKTMHIICLDGSVAFGIISHNILTER